MELLGIFTIIYVLGDTVPPEVITTAMSVHPYAECQQISQGYNSVNQLQPLYEGRPVLLNTSVCTIIDSDTLEEALADL